MPSRPRRMIATCTSQKARNAIHSAAGTSFQPGHAAAMKLMQREPADPGLDAEPPARDDRAKHGRDVRAADAERGAAQDRERHAILRSRVRIEHHRDEDDHVAEQDRDHRLPPGHALLHDAGGERVGGDDHAHADPERGDVVGGPGPRLQRGRREIRIPERTVLQVTRLTCATCHWFLIGPQPRSLRRRVRRGTPW